MSSTKPVGDGSRQIELSGVVKYEILKISSDNSSALLAAIEDYAQETARVAARSAASQSPTQVESSGWVSVEERLPAVGEMVWLADGDDMWIGARAFGCDDCDVQGWLWAK